MGIEAIIQILMEKPMKFLIIQLRQIGDAIISTTLCETLKKNFPDAQVDFVVYPFVEPVIRNNAYIDRLIVLPKSFFKALVFLYKIRKQKYDYCIDILNTNKSALLSYFSGAKHVIGPECNRFRKRLHSILVKADPYFLDENNACNSVKNRLELLTPIKKDLIYATDYKIFLDEKEREKTREFLIQHGIDFSHPLFFCAPVTSEPYKQWPLDYFIQVLNHCIEKYNAQWIACPAPNEVEVALVIKDKLIKPEAYQVFTGLTLRDVPRLLSFSRLYLGNDGGSRHIAIAVGTPSLAVFSPRAFYPDWNPRDPHHIAVSIQDVLTLSDENYRDLLKTKTKEELMLLQPKITPEIVIKKLDVLLNTH
jgi:ADP-heptose:LPS heptosyltransferase